MNGRVRLVPALLAAVCVVSALPAVSRLVSSTGWVRPSLIVVGVSCAAGLVGRRYSRRSGVVLAVQLGTQVWTWGALFVGHTTWLGLPTVQTGREALRLLGTARSSVLRHAAPLPLDAGVLLALGMLIGLLAVSVDFLAVTVGTPAASGLPLLGSYVAASANTGGTVTPLMFALPAAAWMVLVAHDGMGRLTRWTGRVARAGTTPDATNRRWPGRATAYGVIALLAALTLPAVLPHLPATVVANGLARFSGGSSVPGTTLSTTVDVAQSLRINSTDPVFRYRTDQTSPPPLRVDVLTHYAGEWLPSTGSWFDTAGQLPTPAQARESAIDAPGMTRRAGVTTVIDNRLLRPQMAVPGIPTALDVPGSAWRVDANATVRLLESQSTYTLTWEDLQPAPATFGRSVGFFGLERPEMAIDLDSAPLMSELMARIAPEDLTPAATAWRIQSYLRSAAFTYSTELEPIRATRADGTALSPDPVSQFLESRRGYCVQFASAMALMARHRGIPSRIAIGFLPGTLSGDTWTVRGGDAHAWPELWFPETGWLRFEPTPGSRAGLAPSWSSDPGNVAAAPIAPSASPSGPRTSQEAATAPAAGPKVSGRSSSAMALAWIRDHPIGLTALVACLAAFGILPLTAHLSRRRALRRAIDDVERMEVYLGSLLARLEDLGVGTDIADTPRQAGHRIAARAGLDDQGQRALDGVVATLESVRYSPHPAADLRTVYPAVTYVVETVRAGRGRRRRLVAALWPREGRDVWARVTRGGRFRR